MKKAHLEIFKKFVFKDSQYLCAFLQMDGYMNCECIHVWSPDQKKNIKELENPYKMAYKEMEKVPTKRSLYLSDISI